MKAKSPATRSTARADRRASRFALRSRSSIARSTSTSAPATALTNLAIPPASAQSDGAGGTYTPPALEAESVADRIRRERLEQLQRANRAARRDEALAAGTICASEDISRSRQ